MDLSNNENIIILNWNRICRTCLNNESTLCQIDYLDERYKMTYNDMINTCTGLDMLSNDEFPQLICSFCIDQLSTALEFNTKCRSSQNMLIELLTKKKDSVVKIKCEEIELDSNYLKLLQEQNEDIYEIEVKNESLKTTDPLLLDKKPNSEYRSVPTTLSKPQLKGSNREHVKLEVKLMTRCRTVKNKHTCTICETSCGSYGVLLKHKKSHADTCWKCTIVFNDQKEYKEHMKNHNRTDCPECGKVFETREQYRQHMRTHTKDKHLCMICGKNFTLMGTLTAHLRIHSGEKKYKCTYCEKKFIHWGERKHHIISLHTKEKPHECDVCKKRFTRLGHLREHVRSHTGERPYSCSLCDKKFISNTNLRMHMYTHTGERKVICQICNKGFTKKYLLKIHMVTHTGERNHLCLVCGKAFTQSQVLRAHMKTHSKE